MRIQGAESSYIPMQREIKADIPLKKREPVSNEAVSRLQRQSEGKASDLPDQKKLDRALKQANDTMETYGTEVRFKVHKESGEMLVKVINTRDNSVIREIPPERVLDFVAHVKEMLGFIIDKII